MPTPERVFRVRGITAKGNTLPPEQIKHLSYENSELKIKSTFLPAGFGDFYCPACGEVIATMNDDADGNIFVEYEEGACPECGEEIDYSEWLPVITEKTFQII
jgi:predicted RNA-binding Zn-ribbon protein involved in translation (DUF1610 family)